MKKLSGSRIANLIVVLAVSIVPLLYAGLLTLAYQNPTNRLYDIKAAVVNEDAAYTATLADGQTETFNLGADLTEALTHPSGDENVGFTWEQMDAATAQADMNTQKVRAILYIPADFSQIASRVGSEDPSDAVTQELKLVTDDGINYLAGTMAATVASELSNRLEQQGAERVLSTLLLSVSTIRDGLVEASDGATALAAGAATLESGTTDAADGAAQLADGATTLTVGMRELASGAVTLSDGLTTLASSTSTAATGSQQLADGVARLATGTSSAASGADALATGATSLADGASTLASGAATVDSGAQRVSTGAASAASGASTLASGASGVSTGASDLSSGVTGYVNGVEQAYTTLTNQIDPGAQQVSEGLDAMSTSIGSSTDSYSGGQQTLYGAANDLASGAAAEVVGIGSATDSAAAGQQTLYGAVNDYTSGVATAQAGAGQVAAALTGAYQQCVTDHGETDATCQAIAQAAGGLGTTEDTAQTGTVLGGLNALAASSASVVGAVGQVATGADRLSSGATQLQSSVGAAASGAEQLSSGATALSRGLGSTGDVYDAATGSGATLTGVLATLSSEGAALTSGAATVSSGAAQLATGSSDLSAGLNTLSDGATSLSAGTSQLATGADSVNSGAQRLSAGAGTLAGGLGTLASGSATAATSSQSLADGLGRLADGASTASTGADTLAADLGTASSGSSTLAEGATTLSDGLTRLQEGSTTLADGADTLASGLEDGVERIPNYTASQRRTMTDVAADAADVDAVREHAVANNGAGFTPMFMSLALWVGAIALFLVLPALDKRDHGERWYASAIRPAVTAALLAVAQAVVMMVAVNAAGEIHAANLVGLCAMAIAASLTFVAVNQACVATLAFRGRFVSIILLSLQITSMGASFPIETTPRFFQWVHPYLPMSYTQLAFRRLIAGGGVDGIYLKTLAVLAIWALIAWAFILLGARLRRGPRPLPADNALAPTAA
ncbi:putative membrane protein [Actinomyces ruminicola]|uniref:Putative membrane protein n=1 Tax=Actinomyces ruminicola TaxID=332524 RepID=A0A1H0E145_9ACTO|nr:YhgE/Pip domain-containing protein [Actinomyces ruminicola]SDN76164.1 putative membrane protein [Actinomyces ruminicola]